MQVIRLRVALAGAAVLVLGSGVVAVAVGRSAVFPSPAAMASLAKLGTPSYPLALAGDQEVGDYSWVHPGGCVAARAAYQASDAPVPAGSTISDAMGGSLRVTAPYGPSAIFFEDEPVSADCLYAIEREPTVKAMIPGLNLTNGFTPVTCTSVLLFSAFVVGLDTDQGPWTALVVQTDQHQFSARIVKGAPELVAALKTLPADSMVATGDNTGADDSLSFSGTSTAGPVTIDARCTPSQPVKPGG